MKFSYEYYYSTSFVFPLIFLCIAVVILVLEILRFAKVIPPHKTNPAYKYFDMLVFVVGIIMLFLIGIIPLSRSYSLAWEKETDAVSIQGVVQDITDMPIAGKYILGDKTYYSQYITIDNIKYYCMTADYVQKGMSVEIKYLPTSKYILEIERI